MNEGEGGGGQTSVAVGDRLFVQVAGPGPTHKLDDATAKAILDKAARACTLEEAAYAVAWLHQSGAIQLRGSYGGLKDLRDAPVRELEFSADDKLVFPPHSATENPTGRFTVNLGPVVKHLDFPGRPIEYFYNEPQNPHKSMLNLVDVRLVLVLYHLAGGLLALAKSDSLEVMRVLHAGINGTLSTSGDLHGHGRAIDLSGIELKGGQQLMVTTHWGSLALPKGVSRGLAPPKRPGEKLVEKADRYPVFPTPHPDGWTWMNLFWKSDTRALRDAAFEKACVEIYGEAENEKRKKEFADRGFVQTKFRLPAVIAEARKGDPPVDTLKRAEIVFRAAYRVFITHCTVMYNEPHRKEKNAYDESGLGIGKVARAGDHVIHPDHRGCDMRENHFDHFHAGIGRSAYEFPSTKAPGAGGKDAGRISPRDPAGTPPRPIKKV